MSDGTGQQQGGDGGQPWFAGFQDQETRSWVEAKGYKDIEALAHSSRNLESLLGADRAGRTIVLPKDENDAEGMKAFRAKLGVPEDAKGYQLPTPDGMDAKFAETAAAWFHKAGVPPAQARAVTEAWNAHFGELVKQAEAQAAAESVKQLDAVKAEWGQNFDANSEMARRFLKASGLNDEQVGQVESALGTAAMLKTFHKIGSQLGEASFTSGDASTQSAAKAQVRQQIDDLRQRRIEDKISADEYMAQMNTLQAKLAA